MGGLQRTAVSQEETPRELDALVVGAGFGGLYMLHRLRELGFRVRVVEMASGVGGTWFWNRYPGARCDVASIEYSYSFSPALEREWRWTERYAGQPEILRYLNHVADRFDLRGDIQLDTRVEAAIWDEDTHLWHIRTTAGAFVARFLILAVGNLSVPRLPDWPSIERFAGRVMHTAQWPDDVDLGGMRVGIIGTGSSGVQAIPHLAAVAKTLTVFQRTPSYVVPAGNHPLNAAYLDTTASKLPQLREQARHSPFGFFDGLIGEGRAKAADPQERERVLETSWNAGTTGLLRAYGDLLFDEESNVFAAEFARKKIAQSIQDLDKARRLTPWDYPIGARRLVAEIGFFEAMNRPHVQLVDVREEPVVEVRADRIVTTRSEYELDALVCATGFHAITGAAKNIDIQGRNGLTLGEEWADGPRSYLGLSIAGFPNLFMVTGPGSPAVLSNVVVSIEQHVDWIAQCMADLRRTHARTIEARVEAEEAWMLEVDAIARRTLFMKANSWYQGRTRDGRNVFMPYVGGVGTYRERCAAVAQRGYEGFRISGG